jgi:hypothetical protein
MGFIKNLLNKKDEPIKSYSGFWNWFSKNERTFYKSGLTQKLVTSLWPRVLVAKNSVILSHESTKAHKSKSNKNGLCVNPVIM